MGDGGGGCRGLWFGGSRWERRRRKKGGRVLVGVEERGVARGRGAMGMGMGGGEGGLVS